MIYIEKRDEERLVKLWEESKVDWNITPESLLDLVKQGVLYCEDFCNSREVCGSAACFCIREIFPSRDCYEIYTFLRELYLEGVEQEIFFKILEGKIDEQSTET